MRPDNDQWEWLLFLFSSSHGELAEAAAAAVLLVALTLMQLKEVGGDAGGQHMLFVAGVCMCVCAMGLMKGGGGQRIDCSGKAHMDSTWSVACMPMLAQDRKADAEASHAPLDVTLERLSALSPPFVGTV